MAACLRWSVEILVTNIIKSMKFSKSKELVGYICARCIVLVLSLPLLTGFIVQSLLAVTLCQSASTEERNSWEYNCAWHQLRTLLKSLGSRGLRDFWCLLKSTSCFSHHCKTLLWTRAQSDIIHCNAADFLGQCTSTPAVVSTADNNNDKHKNSIDYKIKVIIIKK